MVLLPRPRGALRASLGFCAALLIIPACGGRSDTEEYLYGGDPITVGASASTGGSATAGRPGAGGVGVGGAGGSSGSVGVGASAGVGVGASSPSGGQTGQAGEPSVGGTGFAGSAQGGAATAGTPSVAGAAGMPSGPPIGCGAEVCDANTQSCCGGFGSFQCIAKGAQCQGAVFSCTNNRDCGMEQCCFSVTGAASAAASCKPRCDMMGEGRDRQLCEVDADCRPPARFCTPTVFGVNICTHRQ